MRHLILSAGLMVTGPVYAADAVTDLLAADTVVLRGGFSWDGTYIAGSAGAVVSDAKADLAGTRDDDNPLLALITRDVRNGLFPLSIDDTDGNFAGGIEVGHDRQIGSFIVGGRVTASLFGDTDDIRFSRVDPETPGFIGSDINTTYGTDINALLTADAKIGYALGRAQIYGLAGLALGNVDNRFSLEIPPSDMNAANVAYPRREWSSSDRQFGYVLGAGAQYAVTDQIMLGVEYNFVDLEDQTILASDPPAFGGNEISYRFDNSTHIAKLRIGYKF